MTTGSHHPPLVEQQALSPFHGTLNWIVVGPMDFHHMHAQANSGTSDIFGFGSSPVKFLGTCVADVAVDGTHPRQCQWDSSLRTQLVTWHCRRGLSAKHTAKHLGMSVLAGRAPRHHNGPHRWTGKLLTAVLFNAASNTKV